MMRIATNMTNLKMHQLLTYGIAAVWIANGLFCKILNLVPRHEKIVARILGDDHSRLLTILIGISEVVMAIWILSRFKTRMNAITQILVVVIMNTIEFTLAPDLLLWGRLNAFFAFVFVLVVYCNEFYLKQNNPTV